MFYGTDTTSPSVISNCDCVEFLPDAYTIVLNSITYIGDQGGTSIKTKRFGVSDRALTENASGCGVAFTQTNYREQGNKYIEVYKVVGYRI